MPHLHANLHLRSHPRRVFEMLTTDEGRERFWAETSRSSAAEVELHFPDGTQLLAEVLATHEPDAEGMPGFVRMRYFDGSTLVFTLRSDGKGGTDLELEERDVPEAQLAEQRAGWVSVLLALKAAVDHDVDLRNHDRRRTWAQGYVDN